MDTYPATAAMIRIARARSTITVPSITAKARLRFDHEIPVVDRSSEKSGKVIGKTFRELGKYYQIPTRTAEWSNRQPDVVYVRKPGTLAVNQAAPFDVRCIGMMNLGDFERFTKFESLRPIDPQGLTNFSAAGNGVWRVSWIAAQGSSSPYGSTVTPAMDQFAMRSGGPTAMSLLSS